MFTQYNWKQDECSSLTKVWGQQKSSFQQREEVLPHASDYKPKVSMTTEELACFSSATVCLMWHARRQSVMDLHSSSKTGITLAANSFEYAKETVEIVKRTTAGFKRFCIQILNALDPSESEVLLALKYIAILLQKSPQMQGAQGSEYRLFTVALMLANKFLYDNTYINDTWSEVSGMKTEDLNIMEMEFLNVLDYELTVRKEEYERWRTALYDFRQQLLWIPEEAVKRRALKEVSFFQPSQSIPQHNYHPTKAPHQPVYRPPVRHKSNPYLQYSSHNPSISAAQPHGYSCQNSLYTEMRTGKNHFNHYQMNAFNSIPENIFIKRQCSNNDPPSAYYNPYHTNSRKVAF